MSAGRLFFFFISFMEGKIIGQLSQAGFSKQLNVSLITTLTLFIFFFGPLNVCLTLQKVILNVWQHVRTEWKKNYKKKSSLAMKTWLFATLFVFKKKKEDSLDPTTQWHQPSVRKLLMLLLLTSSRWKSKTKPKKSQQWGHHTDTINTNQKEDVLSHFFCCFHNQLVSIHVWQATVSLYII